MKDLVNNCLHFGSCYTYLVSDKKGKIVSIEKKSFDRQGVNELGREVEGLKWYCKCLGRDPSGIIKSQELNSNYGRVVMKYHSGEVIAGPLNPDFTIDKVQLAVEHYLRVFGSDDFKYSHGDYFIGNIVYRDNEIAWVIDWEHFNDKLPPGYDAINCVIEVFLSSRRKRRSCRKNTIELARNLLFKISQVIRLPNLALKYPATWCRDTALNQKNLWECQYNKLPHIAYSYHTCVEIDKLLGV
jgi:hypothetical protein